MNIGDTVASVRFLTEISGQKQENYVRWVYGILHEMVRDPLEHRQTSEQKTGDLPAIPCSQGEGKDSRSQNTSHRLAEEVGACA